MRLDFVTALRLSLDGEIAETDNEPDVTVIALIDRRGRRLFVPVSGRSHRHRQAARPTGARVALRTEDALFSGTIH